MTDDIKAIRDALAAGPTAGAWVSRDRDARGTISTVGWCGDKVFGPDWPVPYAGSYDSHASCATDAAYIAVCHPERIARLLDALEAAQSALHRIADLDPAIDSEDGYNEWGEADCFSQAQKIARAAMKGDA